MPGDAAFREPFNEWLDTEVSRQYIGATLGFNIVAPLIIALLMLIGVAAFGCHQARLRGKGQPPQARRAVLVFGVAATVLLAYSAIALSVSLHSSGEVASSVVSTERSLVKWLCKAPPEDECCGTESHPPAESCDFDSMLGFSHFFRSGTTLLAANAIALVGAIQDGALVALGGSTQEFDEIVKLGNGVASEVTNLNIRLADVDSSLAAAQAASAGYAAEAPAAWIYLSEAPLPTLPAGFAANVSGVVASLTADSAGLSHTLQAATDELAKEVLVMVPDVTNLNASVNEQVDQLEKFLYSALKSLNSGCASAIESYEMSHLPTLGAPLSTCSAPPAAYTWTSDSPIFALSLLAVLACLALFLLLTAGLTRAAPEKARSRCACTWCIALVVPLLVTTATLVRTISNPPPAPSPQPRPSLPRPTQCWRRRPRAPRRPALCI